MAESTYPVRNLHRSLAMLFVGLSHRTAPIEIRERLSPTGPELLKRLVEHDEVAEALVLSTCNRFEIYVVPSAGQVDLLALARAVTKMVRNVAGHEVLPFLAQETGRCALRHMFRVAASLDSLVIGEPHVLGQFKAATRTAEEHGAMGPTLRAATRRAVQVAKRVRSETTIGEGQASVPSVAARLARRIFDDVGVRKVLLVGAGDMAQCCAKPLASAGGELVVVNRSEPRAQRLAELVGGRARPMSELGDALCEADIVITSTSSPGLVISQKLIRATLAKRSGRSLFLIDIAVPRDVDPAVADFDGVFLFDVDTLAGVVAEVQGRRAAEAERAEAMVFAELSAFEEQQRAETMKPVIVGMRERLRHIMDAELEQSLRGKLKHVSEADRAALRSMLSAAANKILHQPSTRLRAVAEHPDGAQYAAVVADLFDLVPSERGAACTASGPCVPQRSQPATCAPVQRCAPSSPRRRRGASSPGADYLRVVSAG